MRLLNTTSLKIIEFNHYEIPRYAILSHTWGEEEVTFQEIEGVRSADKIADKEGYKKVENCCFLARDNGFEYVWIDTCCIDKTSSAELSEAINSMYRWYEGADICYAYLADVPPRTGAGDEFLKSKWFTRGWTLQELIAPSTVKFLDSQWQNIGERSELQQLISDITGIPSNFLLGDDIGYASVAQRMSWAAKRKTKRIEDVAYCLMGIFGIYMPMLYGEGERAFIRLQEEILRVTNDHSLFAWESTEDHGGLLATTPTAFLGSGSIVPTSSSNTGLSPPTVTSRGIRLSLRLRDSERRGPSLAILDCTRRGEENKRLAIYLEDAFLTKQDFTRTKSWALDLLDLGRVNLSKCPLTDMYVQSRRPIQKQGIIDKCAVKFKGLGTDEAASHMPYLHPNWELFDGLVIRTTVLPADGILGRLLVKCMDGTFFELVLKQRGKFLATDIHDGFGTDAKTVQAPTVLGPQEHERDEIYILESGKHVHVAFGKRVVIIGREKHFMGVVEINYPSTPRLWLEHAAVLEGDEKKTLLESAGKGNNAMVDLILDMGISTENKDENGRTALMLATLNEHKTAAFVLTKKGADINARDTYGQTPLSYAIENRHSEILEIFLQVIVSKAPVRNLLYYQAPFYFRRRKAVLKLLLKEGIDLKYQDNCDTAMLRCAIEKGYDIMIRIILQKGTADLEAKDSLGRTLLHRAAKNEHEAVAKRLLKKGADLEAKDNYGETPLILAILNKHAAVVRLLLEKGANLEAKDYFGQTPLSLAKRNGDRHTVRLLLTRGAR